MAEIQWANFGNALLAGANAARAGAETDKLQGEEERRKQIAPDIPLAMKGDKDAFGRVLAADPVRGSVVAQALDRMDTHQRAQAAAAADYTVKTAGGILGADAASRPQLYDAAKADATARGMDTTSWPATYNEPWVKFHFDQGVDAKTRFIEMEKTKRKGMGGVGAPAGDNLIPMSAPGMPAVPGAPGPSPVSPGRPMVSADAPPGPVVADAGTPVVPVQATPGTVSPVAPPVQVAQAPPQPAAAPFTLDQGGGDVRQPQPSPGMGDGTPRPPAPQGQQGAIWNTDPSTQGFQMMGHRSNPKDPRSPILPAEVSGHFIYRNPQTGETVLYKPRPEAQPERAQPPPGFRWGPLGADNQPTAEPIPGGPQDPATTRRLNIPPGYQPTPEGGLAPIPGGPADTETIERNTAARRTASEKAIPQTITKGIQDNINSLKQLDRVEEALTKTPDSVGGPGSVAAANIPGAGWLQNRMDKEGVQLRALIADIGSMKIHDRSGAAVTVSEFPRLRPFIPSISDDAATVRDKLANFRAEYESAVRDATSYYGPDNGFKAYGPAVDYLQGGNKGKVGTPGGATGGNTRGTYIGPDNRPIDFGEIEATARNRGISTDEVISKLSLKAAGK